MPNATLQDNRKDFDDFPTFDASKSKSDEYSADSDQQDAINTNLDPRSNRRDENTDDAAAEQHGNEINGPLDGNKILAQLKLNN